MFMPIRHSNPNASLNAGTPLKGVLQPKPSVISDGRTFRVTMASAHLGSLFSAIFETNSLTNDSKKPGFFRTMLTSVKDAVKQLFQRKQTDVATQSKTLVSTSGLTLSNVNALCQELTARVTTKNGLDGAFRVSSAMSGRKEVLSKMGKEAIPFNQHNTIMLASLVKTELSELKLFSGKDFAQGTPSEAVIRAKIDGLSDANTKARAKALMDVIAYCYRHAGDDTNNEFSKTSIVISIAPSFFSKEEEGSSVQEVLQTAKTNPLLLSAILSEWNPTPEV